MAEQESPPPIILTEDEVYKYHLYQRLSLASFVHHFCSEPGCQPISHPIGPCDENCPPPGHDPHAALEISEMRP